MSVGLSILVLLAGVVIGALLLGLWMRGKMQVALEQAKAPLALDMAKAMERLRFSEAELATLRQTQQNLQMQLHEGQQAWSLARDELATLSERASRIPSLESQLHDAGQAMTELRSDSAKMREMVGRLTAELKAERDVVMQLRAQHGDELARRERAEAQVSQLGHEAAELRTRLEGERRQAEEKLTLLQEAKESLSLQFKNLANEILEDKSKRFTEQNQVNLGQILDPLKERLSEFKAKVEEIHGKDTEQQATLRAELAQLKDLNRLMTDEAHGLAVALKGQAKKQGNWGELVLGNVLDRSGLREGQDYKREVSFTTEEGRKRPDVVVYLPQSKHLVIDAKVSLNAYTRYVNAEDELQRQQALQEHVSAVSSRIQELADRTYFQLPGLNTPEMVFMFIPIESAFVEALRADEGLFQHAIEKNVLVATPTTLLTSLNIVRQLWRFEEQNVHTAELADRASKVYKKLLSFLASMEMVGNQLEKAKESYGKAMAQLVTGKGNLINQAKEFERLGVSVQAALPEDLLAKAALELEHLPDSADEAEAAMD